MKKIDRLVTAFAFLAAVAISPVVAQTKPPATQSTTPQTSTALPESKVALINTDQFLDEKQGVVRLVAAAKKVENGFQPIRTEIQQLQQKIQQLQDEITKLQQGVGVVVDVKQIQAKSDQLEQLKKDAQRKQEDAQGSYPKRMQEALSPIYEDIGKALDAFGKSRGITLLLDTSKLGPAILMASDAIDITRAFINEFNSKNPATASVAPPPK